MKRYVVSICQGPDCTGNGSDALVPVAERLLGELGLRDRCRLKRGGCYGLCEQGANVIVREDSGAAIDPFGADDYELTGATGEAHYCEMNAERLERVLREHVGEDKPIDAFKGEPQ